MVISSAGTTGQCQQQSGVGSFSGDKIICSDGSQGRRFCYVIHSIFFLCFAWKLTSEMSGRWWRTDELLRFVLGNVLCCRYRLDRRQEQRLPKFAAAQHLHSSQLLRQLDLQQYRHRANSQTCHNDDYNHDDYNHDNDTTYNNYPDHYSNNDPDNHYDYTDPNELSIRIWLQVCLVA